MKLFYCRSCGSENNQYLCIEHIGESYLLVTPGYIEYLNGVGQNPQIGIPMALSYNKIELSLDLV